MTFFQHWCPQNKLHVNAIVKLQLLHNPKAVNVKYVLINNLPGCQQWYYWLFLRTLSWCCEIAGAGMTAGCLDNQQLPAPEYDRLQTDAQRNNYPKLTLFLMYPNVFENKKRLECTTERKGSLTGDNIVNTAKSGSHNYRVFMVKKLHQPGHHTGIEHSLPWVFYLLCLLQFTITQKSLYRPNRRPYLRRERKVGKDNGETNEQYKPTDVPFSRVQWIAENTSSYRAGEQAVKPWKTSMAGLWKHAADFSPISYHVSGKKCCWVEKKSPSCLFFWGHHWCSLEPSTCSREPFCRCGAAVVKMGGFLWRHRLDSAQTRFWRNVT